MADAKTIAIRINADGSVALVELDKIEKKLKKQPGMLDQLKKHWLGISAAVYGVKRAFDKAWNLAEQAARYDQSRQAFAGMVQGMGKDAKAEFAKINQSAGGLIDQATLTEAANRAMSLGIPIEKLGKLMEISRAKARDMGITTTQAFGDIVTGIGRGSPLIIDNLGLTLKVGEANKQYAASIDKVVSELTDEDKKMAILNATLIQGEKALSRHNLQTLTAYENLQKFKVGVIDATRVLGDLISRVGAAVIGVFAAVGAAFNLFFGALLRMAERMTSVMANIPFIGDRFQAAADKFKEAADTSFNAAKAGWDATVSSMKFAFRSAMDLGDASLVQAQEVANQKTGISEKQRKDEVKINNMRWQHAMATAQNYAVAFKIMAEQGGKHARKWFTVYKIAAAGEVAISTANAAMAALTPTKGLGPIYGWALAGAIIAKGAAQLASINKQTFSGGGSIGGGVGTFPVSPGTGFPETATPGGLQNLTINLVDTEGNTRSSYELTRDVINTLVLNNGSIDGNTVLVERSA